MRYAYPFEFCERPELPEWLRGDLFLSLALIQKAFGLSAVLKREAPRLLIENRARRVVELGAGSGDGAGVLSRALAARGAELEVWITDRFPHPELWAEQAGESKAIRWCDGAVGFEDFDLKLGRETLEDAVLLFSAAFHHIPSRAARGVLERAASARASLLIVEPLERDLKGVVLGALTGVAGLAAPLGLWSLFCREPLRWLRLACFHWLMPVIPACLSHDGVISALRQRRNRDWDELLKGLPYEIEIHRGLGLLGNFSATFLKHSGPHCRPRPGAN